MPGKEWTVKELTEALKQFPLDAKVYYEMGQTARDQLEKHNTSSPGAKTTRWECYWTDR